MIYAATINLAAEFKMVININVWFVCDNGVVSEKVPNKHESIPNVGLILQG